jgi:outer membrane protein
MRRKKMNPSNLAFSLALTALAVIPSTTTYAYEKGDLIVRAGPANVSPDSSSSAIRLGGSDIAGTSVSVDDKTTLGITATYMLSNRFGLGVLASAPFQHDIIESGLGIGRIGSTRHLPPTISVQYFPMESTSKLQPYAGLGLNYTTFFDEETDPSLDAALGDSALKLDDSFGLALEIGMDYALTDNWGLNAAVWLIDIDTDATINSPAGEITVDVAIDPTVYMIGATYKF